MSRLAPLLIAALFASSACTSKPATPRAPSAAASRSLRLMKPERMPPAVAAALMRQAAASSVAVIAYRPFEVNVDGLLGGSLRITQLAEDPFWRASVGLGATGMAVVAFQSLVTGSLGENSVRATVHTGAAMSLAGMSGAAFYSVGREIVGINPRTLVKSDAFNAQLARTTAGMTVMAGLTPEQAEIYKARLRNELLAASRSNEALMKLNPVEVGLRAGVIDGKMARTLIDLQKTDQDTKEGTHLGRALQSGVAPEKYAERALQSVAVLNTLLETYVGEFGSRLAPGESEKLMKLIAGNVQAIDMALAADQAAASERQ